MKQVKLLKDWKTKKVGDIINISEKGAEQFIKENAAEYIEKDNLNWEQNKAIELENKLPEVAAINLKEGREKQVKKIAEEWKDENHITEKEQEQIEKEETKKYNKEQIKFKRDKYLEDNKFLFTGFDKFTNFINIANIFIKEQPVQFDRSKIFWLWNRLQNKWEMIDETDLLNAIDKYTNNPTANSKIKYEILESLRRVGRKNNAKEPDKNWIQFKDIIYDIKNKTNFKASPKYFITNPIQWEIGETEDTPTMDRIFKEWVVKEGFQDESYVKTLYEIMAYCLLPSMPIHRIFCLIGNGLNGKGTFLRLIEKLIGEDNKCATEIELLASNRFESANLYKKLVCMVGEIDKGIFKKTKTIKSLSGGDLVRFEFKGKDGFNGHNYAKPLIATNHLPETSDKTKGFYRRWTIVDFPNQFNEIKDPIDEIPNIEFNNFCRKSLRILSELLNKGEFTNDGTIEQRENKYERHSNFVGDFINMYYDIDTESSVDFSGFCDLYNEFLKSEGMNKKSKIEIGRSILLKGYEKKVKKISTGIIASTKMYIFGIKLKEGLTI